MCYSSIQEDIVTRLSGKTGILPNDTYAIARNLLQLEVYYDTFNLEVVTEVPAYSVRLIHVLFRIHVLVICQRYSVAYREKQ